MGNNFFRDNMYGTEIDPVGILTQRMGEVDESLTESANDSVSRGINVKYPFGTSLTPAKGDGTEDTALLQTIIDYAPTYGAVFIPDGNYLISAPLIINNSVSLHLSKNARIYSNTVMDNLIIYNNTNLSQSVFNMSKKITVTGGTLDGNNKVKTVLAISQFLGFFVRDIRIENFLLYGLQTAYVSGAAGAELEASGIHFRNNQANAGSIAIYNNGRDNYFHDIVVIDVETAVWTYDSMWDRIHHWISLSDLIPNSCTLNINDGYAVFSQIYADTIRYPFKLASGKITRINDSIVLWNTGVYTSALATTYPITIFNGDTTVQYYARNNLLAVPYNLTMCQNAFTLGSITNNILALANTGITVTNQVDMNALYQLKAGQSVLSNDLNNANTTGIYTISNPSSTFANYPSGAYAYGVLEVFQSLDQTIQRFTPLSGSTRYTRTGKAGSWGGWYADGGTSGATANRPTVGLYVGMPYFDTTLGKPVWCKVTSPATWVDSTGATV